MNDSSYNQTNSSAPKIWLPIDGERFSPRMSDSVRTCVILLHSLVFCLATVGNSLVIATLVRHRRMRTVTNVFLLNLAVSDLLQAIVCMPFTIVPVLLEDFIFGKAMCIIVRYLQGVTVASSAFTLVAISMERYFAICRPLQARKWQVVSHSYRVIAAVWVAACSMNVPLAAFNGVREKPDGVRECADDWPSERSKKAWYTFQLLGVDLLAPLVIMTVTYSLITRSLSSDFEAITLRPSQMRDSSSLKKRADAPPPSQPTSLPPKQRPFQSTPRDPPNLQHSSPPPPGKRPKPLKLPPSQQQQRYAQLHADSESSMRSHCSQASAASKRKVVKMLVVIVMEFFVCWTPLYVVLTWYTLDPASATRHVTSPPTTLAALRLAAYASSCCNPITYCFMSNKFRSAFLMAFRCRGDTATHVERRFQNTLETCCDSPRKLDRQLTFSAEGTGGGAR